MLLVQQLSRYLRSHATACDATEGIARWWIEGNGLVPLAIVERALEWLQLCGVVEMHKAADGRIRYRRKAHEDTVDTLLDVLSRDPQSVMPSIGAAAKRTH